MNKCPCGSGFSFEKCCEPLLKDTSRAQKAEELMRSRYTAYVVIDIPYLIRTTHPDMQQYCDTDSIHAWAKRSKWHGLEIIKAMDGANENEEYVEFVAHYSENNVRKKHHEIAKFIKENDTWYYLKGKIIEQKLPKMSSKIGRNDPCSCGSKKKYKKCCGS